MGVASVVDDSDPDETGGLQWDPDHYPGPGAAALGTPFRVEELAEDDYRGHRDRCCGDVSGWLLLWRVTRRHRLLTNKKRRQISRSHGEVQRKVCAHGAAVEERIERWDTDEPSLLYR